MTATQHKRHERAKQWQNQRQDEKITHRIDHHEPNDWHEVKTLLDWEAPGRPFKRRSREYFINAFLLTMIIEIILFLFSQYLLMFVVFSLLFLSYAMASVPPRSLSYQISSEGVRVENHFYIWKELYDFYVLKQYDDETIYIRTNLFYPGELTIMPGDHDTEEIKKLLARYIPFREYVEPTFLQRSGEWLERNFPLEKNTQ